MTILKRQDGVTLLELMTVLMVIAILVTIAVPVAVRNSRAASSRVATYNSRVADKSMDFVWFHLVDQERPAGQDERYRDWDPVTVLKETDIYHRNSWYPIDARYMSSLSNNNSWVSLSVVKEQGSSRFRVYEVWKRGDVIAGGTSQDYYNWSLIHGRIGILVSQYWMAGDWREDGQWRQNGFAEYVTTITLDPVGVANYSTLRSGVIIDSGTFDWNDGYGHP